MIYIIGWVFLCIVTGIIIAIIEIKIGGRYK